MDYSDIKRIALESMRTSTTSKSLPISDAVRQTLDWFAKQNPGNSVEVRVPPFRVVQILEGVTHRRGAPSAVVEMSPATWLRLIAGVTSWENELEFGTIHASGERSNLSEIFATTVSN